MVVVLWDGFKSEICEQYLRGKISHNLSSKQLLGSLYVFMDETQNNTHLHEAHAAHHLDALISDRPCCFLPQEQKQKNN